ncbi:nuclear membrane organization protein Apq12 [Schizosaccharomyces japonicus yFS275]|uniref:Nuclear membrane organization protein Apq12 n=1 Tax=Schizosaccharomyces japonicus (strain yFS275 / FY16936) TaxID=402676 RepID=B6K772_SCHJY|nr:nuclear membrane organization protein Apq12 [Schizosaccharomyces japonicus yFS275]EEB09376.1 nuclear membrane organization protein Apq12 [Schizosaccharomyces japonicus yFS275]
MSPVPSVYDLLLRLVGHQEVLKDPAQMGKAIETLGKQIEEYKPGSFSSLISGKINSFQFTIPSFVNLLVYFLIFYVSLLVVNKTTRVMLTLLKSLATVAILLLIVCMGVLLLLR